MDEREARLLRSAVAVRGGARDRLSASVLGVGAMGAPARWGDRDVWGDDRSDAAGADAERERIRAVVAEVHRRRVARRARRRVRRI